MKINLRQVSKSFGFHPDCKWLGIVIDDTGRQGNLMQGPEGAYFSVRMGQAHALDPDAVAMALAEAVEAKLGRPTTDRRYVRSVTLSATDVERARKAGGGNVSAGISKALAAYVYPTDGSS